MSIASQAMQGAFIALESDPSKRVVWQTTPTDISIGKSARYTEVEISGRSEPYAAYESSTATTYGFTLTFVDSIGPEEDPPNVPGVSLVGIMHEKVKFLYSLVHPRISGIISRPPSPVYFVVGGFIAARCRVTDVRPAIPSQAPWDFQNGVGMRPKLLTLGISLSEMNSFLPGEQQSPTSGSDDPFSFGVYPFGFINPATLT